VTIQRSVTFRTTENSPMVTIDIGKNTNCNTGRIREKVMVKMILAMISAIQLLNEMVGKNQARMAKTMIDLSNGRSIEVSITHQT
jgi:hypothetical protein